MSIKTLPGPDGQDPRHISVFLILSAIIHVAALGGFYFLAPAYRAAVRATTSEPVIVDVVELPPGLPENPSETQKTPTHYAQRSQSVTKETYPAPRPDVKGRGSVALPPSSGSSSSGSDRPAQKSKDTATAPNGADAGQTKTRLKVPESGVAQPLSEEAKDDGSTQKTAPQEPGPSKTAKRHDDSGQPQTGHKGAERAGTVTRQRPNLFLTEERITELEKKYEAAAPQGEVGKTLQLNTAEHRYQGYLIDMKQKIERYWEFPDIAQRNGWQGKLRIDFTIFKNGSVGNIRLLKSSNYPVLDDAAVTALRLAAPFPPFPEDFGIEDITIKGQFQYNIIYTPGPR